MFFCLIVIVCLIAKLVDKLFTLALENTPSLLATHYYCDMGNKLQELMEDSSMMDGKWKEWLPIFEDADTIFAKTHPYIQNPPQLANIVRDILNNDDEEVLM